MRDIDVTPPSSAGLTGTVVSSAVERGVGWMRESTPGQHRIVISREELDAFDETRTWDHPTQATFRRFRDLVPSCLLDLAR